MKELTLGKYKVSLTSRKGVNKKNNCYMRAVILPQGYAKLYAVRLFGREIGLRINKNWFTQKSSMV